MKKLIAALFLSSVTTSLYAATFQLQNIRVGGVGCPSELTQIVLAPDSSAASLIFAQFESRVPNLEAGPKVQRSLSSLNCNIFLDVKVPVGVKLDSLEVKYDMRGFATLERGVMGSFKSYLVSKTGLGVQQVGRAAELMTEKVWSNTYTNQEEDFTVSATKLIPLYSQCAVGSSSDIVSIRIQHTLASQILAGFESQSEGSITMDSSDIKGGLKISALGSSCYAANNNSGTPHNPLGRNCRVVRNGGRSERVCN